MVFKALTAAHINNRPQYIQLIYIRITSFIKNRCNITFEVAITLFFLSP